MIFGPPALLYTIQLVEKQPLAGKRDPGHDQILGIEFHCNSSLLQGWWENYNRNSLWWNGNGSNAGIIWVLCTCEPTKSLWSIPHSTSQCTEPCVQEQGCLSRTENVEVCKGIVIEKLARESHQLQEQKIDKISAALEVQVYGAEMVTTTKPTQIQVSLNWAQQAPTNSPRLICSWEKSDCTIEDIRYHLKNGSFLIKNSNFVRNDCCNR